jgi:GrpB-like predicted nucleotidyltransferase (UPF0157 family)
LEIILELNKKNIQIVQYRDSWPAEFISIASILRRGLGGLALRIDHIGSTSVPGLAAKDIIDIQITMAELNEQVDRAMLAMGYTRVAEISQDHQPAQVGGAAEDWQKWYYRPPAEQRPSHFHVRVMGRLNQQYPLLFRDYLRTHPATAQAYAELKRRLADNLADADSYPDVKDPAVDLIYLAAEEWAVAVGWVAGDSDA